MRAENEEYNRGSWWNDRYLRGDTGWDQNQASPALVDAIGHFVAGGRILVPGCGYGHDAAGLAAAGFTVEGWDVSDSAVEGAQARYSSENLLFRNRDLFATQEVGSFDGIFEHTFLCAVGPEWYERTADCYLSLLKPGGFCFAVLFTGLDEENPPPWRIEIEDVYKIFGDSFEILFHRDARTSFEHRRGEETHWLMQKSSR